VKDATLGLVLRNGKYALSSNGSVGLVGLPGLDITGSFGVKANKLGTSVDETVTTPPVPLPYILTTTPMSLALVVTQSSPSQGFSS
jgi:hypothetical protein